MTKMSFSRNSERVFEMARETKYGIAFIAKVTFYPSQRQIRFPLFTDIVMPLREFKAKRLAIHRESLGEVFSINGRRAIFRTRFK